MSSDLITQNIIKQFSPFENHKQDLNSKEINQLFKIL